MKDSKVAMWAQAHRPALAMGVTVLFVATIIFVAACKAPKTADTTATDATATQVAQIVRDERFVQNDVGYGILYRLVGAGLAGETGEELRNSALENAGHSASVLAILANQINMDGSPLWGDPNDTTSLLTEDGAYLSPEGIALWEKVQVALTAGGMSNAGLAPENGVNSGVQDGVFGSAGFSGITGDRTALIVTFKDGSTLTILKRCGNIVFPSVPEGVPTVTTDETPPSGGGETPPSLTPKNPADDVTPPQGVTRLPAGDLTDGQQSGNQKSSGQTSGNVTDNSVGGGTTSGSTTSDTGSGVTVGGANSQPDDISNDVKDDSTTVYDNGGTNGNTHISDPG